MQLNFQNGVHSLRFSSNFRIPSYQTNKLVADFSKRFTQKSETYEPLLEWNGINHGDVCVFVVLWGELQKVYSRIALQGFRSRIRN
jgi:hypothetical protein